MSRPRKPAAPAEFAPGTHGCHEALHMASVLRDMVEEQLCTHPAIRGNRQWRDMAEKAEEALYGLYQAIAQEHLGA